MDHRKRWMAVARPCASRSIISITPVGEIQTLLARLSLAANGASVALGVDFPIGLPRGYAIRHARGSNSFLTFLDGLRKRPEFFQVASLISEVNGGRPFYPQRGLRGMTRLSLAQALDLPSTADLSRVCDRMTTQRPAGAPLFWTLGANQSGKAAISAWRDLLLPALASASPPKLWPFEGPFRRLLQPGRVVIAETYPADAMRQLGLRLAGSKRRQADRATLGDDLRAAMHGLAADADERLNKWLDDGFGPEPAGEDRLDCLLGLLCVLLVVAGKRPDWAPADPWITQWEGWVLGQAAP